MRSEVRAKVLLEQSRQRGLEPARRPMDEHAEVDRAENAPPHRSQGRHRHPVGSEVEYRQTRPNGVPQLRTSRARMGTTQSVVARLESGAQMPSVNTLLKFAKATRSRPIIKLLAA